MKRIKKALWVSLSGILLSVFFLLALVYQTPAVWITHQLESRWPELRFVGVTGHLGQGSIEQLHWHEWRLDQLGWRWSLLSLVLLKPRFEVTLGEEAAWQAQLSATPWGRVDLGVSAGDLRALPQGAGLDLAGRLNGHLALQANWRQASCVGLEGHWQGELQLLAPVQLDLGAVFFEADCADVQELHWQLRAVEDQHRLTLEGSVLAQQWRFQGQADLDATSPLLSWMGLLRWRSVPSQTPGLEQGFQGRASGRW
ncbi:type II secretion system protein N [Marinospirillum sp. MEB164]|uniref:Type II secretion system protein N n=1 Tax=Marinospirillum alkalitolerans TaxID=3123374 RepID=A0ABW8PZI1_9GAMM